MNELKIALLQLSSSGLDQEKNIEKGETYVRHAKQMGADIALFPEMWNIGYTPYHEEVWERDYNPHEPKQSKLLAEWVDTAIDLNSDFLNHFRKLAKELELAIGITFLEQFDPKPRNSFLLIDRFGHDVLHYAKVHTCDFSLEWHCTPGESFVVEPLDTKKGPVNIGAMICYDREFPESARILMLKGAEIILIPNACEMEINRMSQLRARAYENMVGVALSNYADTGGHSVAFSGMAYDLDGHSLEMEIIQANEAEGIFIASFPLDDMRLYRSRETMGNAFRKPKCYKELLDEQVMIPFKRSTAKR